jgi:hypothetical protein
MWEVRESRRFSIKNAIGPHRPNALATRLLRMEMIQKYREMDVGSGKTNIWWSADWCDCFFV